MRICLGGDGLYACGEGFQVAKDYRCDYIYTFQPGRLPALWEDFQGLLRLCPDQRVERMTPQGVRQVYRWINGLHYRDRPVGTGSSTRWSARRRTRRERRRSGHG